MSDSVCFSLCLFHALRMLSFDDHLDLKSTRTTTSTYSTTRGLPLLLLLRLQLL